MTPLSHCEQSNKTTILKRQTATVEKRFPDFWQILPEWAPNRCLGYYDTSECPENTKLIWFLPIVNNMLGALAVLPVQSYPVSAISLQTGKITGNTLHCGGDL
jgi:hypothetical protein